MKAFMRERKEIESVNLLKFVILRVLLYLNRDQSLALHARTHPSMWLEEGSLDFGVLHLLRFVFISSLKGLSRKKQHKVQVLIFLNPFIFPKRNNLWINVLHYGFLFLARLWRWGFSSKGEIHYEKWWTL